MKMNDNKKLAAIVITFPLIFQINFGNDQYQNHNPNNNYLPMNDEISLDYFPVDTSLKLIYNSSLGEAASIIKKEDKSYILDMRNDDFFFIQTIHLENDSVYLTKLDQEIDIFLFITAGVKVTYDEPSLRFPFPLNIGDKWVWNGVECIDDEHRDTISITGQVLGSEMIDTEAGTFDCVKFQIDINKKRGNTRFFEWRTPNIGLVKLEAYINTKGFIGSVMSILGYDEMSFVLKKII
jgi:hypothetical protein